MGRTVSADTSSRGAPASGWWRQRVALRCRSIADFRRAAKRRLPRSIFDFVDGGAEDELTLAQNTSAYRSLRFRPQTLIDVKQVSTRQTILGAESSLPLIVGPTGALGFSWPRGDLAIAAAAAAAGIPFALSSSASVSIEEVAAGCPGRLWFQCYIFKQRDFTLKLIERARRAGYDSLIITVDFPVGGNRERDFRNDFAVPFRYTPRNVLDFATHPWWSLSILRHGTPTLANLSGFTSSGGLNEVASSVGRNYDASFAWHDLKAIRDLWKGKLIVKGISRPEDADRLVAMGVDAIAVSNHGGRQLDGAYPTLLCLPEIAQSVHGKAEVFVDGGVRRGSDIVKALALGAKAVLIGRPTVYAVAAAGPAGPVRALEIFRQEFQRTLQLCGVTSVGEIGSHLLARGDILGTFEPTVAARLLAETAVAKNQETIR